METLYLVKLSLAWKEEILAYKQAFTGEHLHGGSHLQQMDNFEEWLEHVENEASPATCRPNRAPSSTFICIREQDKKWWAFAISAIISIRHFWSISPVTSATPFIRMNGARATPKSNWPSLCKKPKLWASIASSLLQPTGTLALKKRF